MLWLEQQRTSLNPGKGILQMCLRVLLNCPGWKFNQWATEDNQDDVPTYLVGVSQVSLICGSSEHESVLEVF